MKRLLIAGAALLAMVAPAAADTLADIIAKGKLVAGVKTDYAPWGMRDAQGNIVGLEIDMLQDFVKRIGASAGKTIELELVPVVASNRMQFLEQGKIDVMIATMSDTAERRKVVGILQPNYYSSGVAVFAHKDSGISSWESVAGKKICGIQGAWYNKDHGERNGAEIVAFKGVPEVEAALLDGRCVGWLYDDSAFIPRKVNDPAKWADYAIATPVVADAPWGAAVRLADLDAPLGKALSDAIIDWHKSGTIVALEKKWNIPATRWVADMAAKCQAGDKVCDGVRD
ncbi:MAG: transporter substrate-binding domain-containing protein [Rhizobiales bacterium]|nr:transporter substrate-binding domain-containing protein [Hyphomicrobiales bacterium]